MLFLSTLHTLAALAAPVSHESFQEWVRAAADADELDIERWGSLDLDRDGQADDAAAWLCDTRQDESETGSPWLVYEVDGRRGVVERSEEVRCWKPSDGPPEFRALDSTGIAIRVGEGVEHSDYQNYLLSVVDGQLEVTHDERGAVVSFPSGTTSRDWVRRVATDVNIEWLPEEQVRDGEYYLAHTVEGAMIVVGPDDADRPTLNRVVSGAEAHDGPDDASFTVVAVEPVPEEVELVIRVTDDVHTGEDQLELRWSRTLPSRSPPIRDPHRPGADPHRRLGIRWSDDHEPVSTWLLAGHADEAKPRVARRADGALTVRFTYDDLGLMHRRVWGKAFTVVFVDVDSPSEVPTHIATSDLGDREELRTSAAIVRYPDLHAFPTHLASTRSSLAITSIRTLEAERSGIRRTEDDLRREREERRPHVQQVLHSLRASLVELPGETFVMGCDPDPDAPASDATACHSGQQPAHPVTLSAFHLMRTEVTQEQWEAVMGDNPSAFAHCGPDCPVEHVSWFDAVRFANALSDLSGLDPAYTLSGETVSWDRSANGYRLPTEAEWEYAAAGGQAHAWPGSPTANEVAWHRLNSDGRTQPVCRKQPNGYGLCDMGGNVYEWLWDWYGPYSAEPATDPAGPESGRDRSRRGGAWSSNPPSARVTARSRCGPAARSEDIGFRLARSAP